MGWFSNFSHHGCNGNLDKIVDLHGMTVFKCDKCGKKFTDKGEGWVVVRQREG